MDLEHIPFISLIVIPLVGFLYRQLSKLNEESVVQETAIDGLKLYVENLDRAMSRKAELEVLVARLEGLAHRIDRAENSIDKLRNGNK